VDHTTLEWVAWAPPDWSYPQTDKLDFSNLLVPTMDSTRSLYLLKHLHKQKIPVLCIGGPGTAKTSTCYMFLDELDGHVMLTKVVNFSSATTPFMAQNNIEDQLDKRGGKNFGPPNGMKLTFFLDDMSMPLINTWGDQPTLEAVRLVVEYGYFTFLDKDKRGDFKVCEDLQYIAAMGHPGGGRNDIPNRLKSSFFNFNMVLPSLTSINNIYGQMLDGRFRAKEFNGDAMQVVSKLTQITIKFWGRVKGKMLPTPAKFHYIFNMRDLSRVFQGVLFCPKETIRTGGGLMCTEGKKSEIDKKHRQAEVLDQSTMLLALWKHECERAFGDKLTNEDDKNWFSTRMQATIQEFFGDDLAEAVSPPMYMVSCLREDVYDVEGVFQDDAPQVYEVGGTLADIRDRVTMFMNKYNEEFPQKKLELVLFQDALRHMLRISRLIEMPRGSGLLVGVGGSGKQSLTRIAGYLSRSFTFQIVLTKTYNTNSLMEDLKILYKSAGHMRKTTVFLFTEAEIKDEIFLELINSVLMTGEIAGLFAKDEMMAITADLQVPFKKEREGVEENQINLNKFFIDCARDNLHLFLCMSPINPKFPVRARMFPGLINGPTIDWFLPWPEEALVTVADGFIMNYKMACDKQVKSNLIEHMGNVHTMVSNTCEDYFSSMRRKVYQTPKSYLSFIQQYKKLYGTKLIEIDEKASRVNLGLEKLVTGAEDVEKMKVVLADEQVKLEHATEETNKMLAELEISSAAAKKEGDAVAVIAAGCQADAERIGGEKAQCMRDLAKAQPFVDEAETAIDSIKAAHINEIKKLPKPSDIIKLVFDGVLLLFKSPLNKVVEETLLVAKKDVPFIATSFVPHSQQAMSDTGFLKHVQDFGKYEKDLINEETVEFMLPYMELENFTPAVAKNASAAAEGLCTWVRAMKYYHEASKIVKPKLEALGIAEAQMEVANKALAEARKREAACKARLADLQTAFETQMAEKKRIEDGAQALANKMEQASQLIGGLAGERKRWTEDSKGFESIKNRLVGDCAIGAGFISYCGPFNQDFRQLLLRNKFYGDAMKRNVPATKDLDIISFLVDIGTIGDWNQQKLPTDGLSIQNGILVTRSTRFPLLIDPQAQAITWIRDREASNMPPYGATNINHPKLKDQLEFCMSEGKALVIAGVEEEIDPMLDPVMEKEIIVKGKSMSINVGDKNMDYNPSFMMYFITRLPNPHFSPELQAKTTVVDFTVTQKGLEEQLLGKVISKEQHALEEQLNQVISDVNANTKTLLKLDNDLLNRLTSNTGNLLEDDELIGVLANTKSKAAEVSETLIAADETKKSINEKRESFRPVATRGSVLYFAIVEMSLVNCMYQVSLEQFTELFMASMDNSEKAALASQRVTNIIGEMTYSTYRYINRGLYEPDKLLFVLLFSFKVLVTAGTLPASDIRLFLQAGAALDINTVKKKPFAWISNEAWLNAIQLSQSNSFFSQLPNEMAGNDAMWRRWYEDNEPETMAIPDYEQRIADDQVSGPFKKLLLVRSLRLDRSVLMCKQFVANTKEIGPEYVEPCTDTMESIFQTSEKEIPIIFLLSPGADPTEGVETLARKKKMPAPVCVSLGQGQEPVAIKAMNIAAANGGSWVMLQNCELGLPLMVQMEELLMKLKKEDNFRLFMSCLPSNEFPLGLLQMSTKVTNEPPAGLRAGLMRSYIVTVDQDRLERIETPQWRQLIFALCFMHSVLQERIKYGPLGWSIKYEFSTPDLEACLKFLERHLYSQAISWVTVQYNVCECQYGCRITDMIDRRLMDLFTRGWINAEACKDDFKFNPLKTVLPIPFDYVVPKYENIADWRTFCATLPALDSPEMCGLHPNADLTFRVKEATSLMTQMSESQPKGGGGGGGISPAEEVFEKCSELLSRLPEDYNADEYKEQVRKLGGLGQPLNIFLFQEVQRLQNVIGKVRFILSQLKMAIRGEVVMTEELATSLQMMFEAKPPTRWVFTIAGDEFSWILPSLGLWFSALVGRDDQNRGWLTRGRPLTFWLTGFFNPQGLLTAMKQEVTRKHRGENWALDDVVYHTEVTHNQDAAHVRQPPPEGIYLHGLWLDGGAWSRHEGHLVEQEPKKLFVAMPVLLISGNINANQVKVNKEMFGASGALEAPLYKYTSRTDRFFVAHFNLKCTVEKGPLFWGKRGVALLMNSD
jgi:dynein heavy chain